MLFVLGGVHLARFEYQGSCSDQVALLSFKSKRPAIGVTGSIEGKSEGFKQSKGKISKDGSKIPSADQSWWDPPHWISSGLNLVAPLLRCRVGELTFLGLSHQISCQNDDFNRC